MTMNLISTSKVSVPTVKKNKERKKQKIGEKKRLNGFVIVNSHKF
jgi:hypothetical protein